MSNAQGAKEQLMDGVSVMFKEHFARYQEKNGDALPESIIYYRDDLSEGQFQQILDSEGRALKSRFQSPSLR